MDTNKATFEQAVLARLPAIEPDEMEFVQRAIADCFEKKFTVMEAAMKLRFLEHVDPVVDESNMPWYYAATRQQVYDNKWLDFEPLYRKVGWKVEYYKPGFIEAGKAFWRFFSNV